jgi:hypothetical protein
MWWGYAELQTLCEGLSLKDWLSDDDDTSDTSG